MIVKKLLLVSTICSLLLSQASFAQKKERVSLEVGGSLDVSLYDASASLGLGCHLKMLRSFNTNKNALVGNIDISLLSDVGSFGSDIDLLFLLASIGYHFQNKNFFLEPKIGGGLFNDYNYNSPCLFIGIEPGIRKNRLCFSIDFRFVTADGIVDGSMLGTAFLKVGYEFH